MSKKIWIVQKHNLSSVRYETERLLEEGGKGTHLILYNTVDLIISREDRKSLRVRGQTVSLPDIVLPRTGSGTRHFGASVLRHLERLGVKTVNKSDAVETVADKVYAHQVISQADIPNPKTMLVKHPVDPVLVEKQIGFPCIVKVLSGSYGKGIYQSNNKQSFKDLLEFIHNIKPDEPILVQEFVNSRPGVDVRVIVVGDRCLGAMQRVATDGSFKANITRGGVAENVQLTTRMEELALKTAKALDLEIAGVDLLYDNGDFKVCEANSAPGFKGFEKATGVNVAKAIMQYTRQQI